MRAAIFCAISLLVFVTFGCGQSAKKTPKAPSVPAIKTYKDIPGVTSAEIAAIETLKADRDKFSYGALVSTEVFTLPDGTHEGFTVEFCRLLTELFDIPFVLEPHEWNVLVEKLESQSVDFTGEMTPTEERKRAKKYVMTHPIAERQLRIFTLAGSNAIQTEAGVEGRTIAFLEGTVIPENIRKVYRVSFNVVEVPDIPHAVKILQNGEIDAFIDECTVDHALDEYAFQSRIFFPAIYFPVSMTTANPELAPVISVINKYIVAGGGDKLFELYKDGDFVYAKNKLFQSLTDVEKAYIKDLTDRNATVDVALEIDNYPIDFYNEKEREFQGIALDILEEISKLVGIKFVNANPNGLPWADIYDKFTEGEITMMAELQKSDRRKDYFLWSDIPYARSRYALMSRIDFPNISGPQVMQHIVAAVKSSGHVDVYRNFFPNNNNLREYDTYDECLDALEKGEVDLLLGSEYVLITHVHYREKAGFKINMFLGTPLESYFGFTKNEQILCSIVSKAQQFVPTSIIEHYWTGISFDYSKKRAAKRTRNIAGFAGLVSMILLVTVFLLVRTIRLGYKLREMASKDGLTNIYNRRTFVELARNQIEHMNRTGGMSFVVIFDLDHFKRVNDTYGHIAGDHVLIAVAQMVKTMVRPYDIFARFGGEEFVILMSDVDEANTVAVVERIRQEMYNTPIEYKGRKISIAASFGIAIATPQNDLQTAIQQADVAMYQAKDGGRNQTIFHTKAATRNSAKLMDTAHIRRS
ncbi:MAG: GGDEF domain-containing protein [Planctomycetaceae bacterium]|jgi:diguanylate cyclase (GGDEF)-like protein|nr:GGDEF domain-containing protein [Planctomycetaceae bacterium]